MKLIVRTLVLMYLVIWLVITACIFPFIMIFVGYDRAEEIVENNSFAKFAEKIIKL